MLIQGTGAVAHHLPQNFEEPREKVQREGSIIFALLVDLVMQCGMLGHVQRVGSWSVELGSGWSVTMLEGCRDGRDIAQAMIARHGRIRGLVTPHSETFHSKVALRDFRAELDDVFCEFADVDARPRESRA